MTSTAQLRPQDTEDRAHGALLGLACGDALGVPLIGLGREQARIKHATVTRFLGGGLHLLAPGDATGRVLMARASAGVLTLPPPYEDRLVDAWLAVLDSGRPGLGDATRAALERMRDGVKRAEAPREAHEAMERRSAGIGPALRAVPYALRYLDDAETLSAAVLADAALTHADPRAGAAALALVLWVREHLASDIDAADALARVRSRLASQPLLPDVLPAEAAVRRFPVKPTAFAPDVLHAVVRHVLGARSAKQAIVGAANEAGAASALAAATGAVAGARFGLAGLPEGWISVLPGRDAWGVLADRLLERGRAGTTS